MDISREFILRARKVLARGIPELVEAGRRGSSPSRLRRRFPACLSRNSKKLKYRRPRGRSLPVAGVGLWRNRGRCIGPCRRCDWRGRRWTRPMPAGRNRCARSRPRAPRRGRRRQSWKASPATARSGSSDGWLWREYIPAPGVTAIVGGLKYVPGRGQSRGDGLLRRDLPDYSRARM